MSDLSRQAGAPADDFCCVLVDNGSKRAEATLELRRLASAVSEAVGHRVEPVSLLHSSGIDPAKLGGVPAEIFEPFVLRKARDEGVRRFLVLPLFFGPSGAVVDYLPQRVEALSEKFPGIEVRVAPCLVNVDDVEDTGIAEVLADLVRKRAREAGVSKPAVAVADHGTPRCEVNAVRGFVAAQLRRLLGGDDVSRVEVCAMERRDGDEYGFNDPLLENLLGTRGFDREVILSMMFILPGRHAGPGGDVAEICAAAEGRRPGLRVWICDLVSSHPRLIEVLARRFEEMRL